MRQLKISRSITVRDSEALERYLQDISKEHPLSAEEEVELSERIAKGDEKALEKLVRSNLKFVVSVAKQYRSKGMPLSDLINEGNMGLVKAAQRYDPTKGFKFISYAVWWIRQSILQAIADNGNLVRIPVSQQDSINKIRKIEDRFEQENQRKPSRDEILEYVDIPDDKLDAVIQTSLTRQVSVDEPFADGEGNGLLDIIPNEDAPLADSEMETESMKTEILDAIGQLNAKEQIVIRHFYGIGCDEITYDEIATMLGVKRERVRQLKDKALQKLRKTPGGKALKEYLGKKN